MDVVRWEDLRGRLGRAEARWQVAHDEWTRVVRGSYVPADVPTTTAVRLEALRSVLPSDVVPTGRTALWLLDVVATPGRLDLLVPRGRHLVDRPGVRLRSAHLPPEELCLVDGCLTATAARACVDLLREEPAARAVPVVDAALRRGAVDAPALAASLARAAGLRGVTRARSSAALVDGRSESVGESLLRLALVAGGVDGIESQVDVWCRAGHVGRADLYVRGVFVEFDGREVRLDREVFVAERRRQTRIAEAGHELRRFTWDDVTRRSAVALAAEVLRARASAAARPLDASWRGRDTLRPPARSPLPTVAELDSGS